jgi:beta-N-acetylhexosaminidase
MGAAVIRGLQENGMLATGKHFPGHGDTEVNSHLALASVTAGRARLDSVELAPFRAAIEAGVGAIMTFHGFFPALDREQVPATLSPRVMTDLLRRELKFDGLLVTDAMTMRGVVDTYGDVEAAKRAIAAGNDVLLMPTDTRQAIEAVVAGVRESRYDEARLNASVKRVLQLKHQFELHRERLVPVEAVRRVVGDSAHEAAAQRLADQSFVLVRDSGAAIPIVRSGSRPRVLSLTYARRTDLSAGGVFADELARRTGPVRSMYVNADELAPNVSHVIAAATQQDVIVVSSYVNITSETATADAPQPLNDLMRQLVATGKPVVLITFGTPYLLRQLPFVPTYAIAWGSTGASQRAAARAITGEMAVRGRLPISIPPLIPVGAGLQRSSR